MTGTSSVAGGMQSAFISAPPVTNLFSEAGRGRIVGINEFSLPPQCVSSNLYEAEPAKLTFPFAQTEMQVGAPMMAPIQTTVGGRIVGLSEYTLPPEFVGSNFYEMEAPKISFPYARSEMISQEVSMPYEIVYPQPPIELPARPGVISITEYSLPPQCVSSNLYEVEAPKITYPFARTEVGFEVPVSVPEMPMGQPELVGINVIPLNEFESQQALQMTGGIPYSESLTLQRVLGGPMTGGMVTEDTTTTILLPPGVDLQSMLMPMNVTWMPGYGYTPEMYTAPIVEPVAPTEMVGVQQQAKDMGGNIHTSISTIHESAANPQNFIPSH
jgi:hypothetical protein